MPNPWDNVRQLPDDNIAGNPWFHASTYETFQAGLEALLAELQEHRKAIEQLELGASPFEEEVDWMQSMVNWGKTQLAQSSHPRDHVVLTGVSVRSLRYLKAAALYKAFLVARDKEEFLRKQKTVPRSVLKSFDAKIEQLRNMAEMGKLGGLRPADVIFELIEAESNSIDATREAKPISVQTTVAWDIPIVDPVLRKRCLAILNAVDGASGEQLDSVVREMSVVVEDRVRELSKYTGGASGAELFGATMARDPILIRFSTDSKVQEATHLLFRGFSGLVRNEVMHRLVPTFTRERVLQLLGMIDYLLYLLAAADVPAKAADG